jgi:hypothetical protein
MEIASSLLNKGLGVFYRWHLSFDLMINLLGSFSVIRIYVAAKLHIFHQHVFGAA